MTFLSRFLKTPKRTHIVKTRLDDEEYADFLRRMEIYDMSQSEYIREAISGATIRLVVVASPINDELLSAFGRLTADKGGTRQFEKAV